MPSRREGPLTAEHLDGLNTGLRHVATAMRILEKCQSCGVECDMWCQYADVLKANMEAMRREFFGTLGEAKE